MSQKALFQLAGRRFWRLCWPLDFRSMVLGRCGRRVLAELHCSGHQRPRLLYRPRLPEAADGCAERDAGRVSAGVAGGAAGGAAHVAGERDRAGRHGPGLDRPRHGRVLALQGGAGGGRQPHVGARGAAHHQRRARRRSSRRQEGDYDSWTRFALTWFQQHGFDTAKYGEAEMLANARDVSVQGVAEAGISLPGQPGPPAAPRRAARRLRAVHGQPPNGLGGLPASDQAARGRGRGGGGAARQAAGLSGGHGARSGLPDETTPGAAQAELAV